MQAASISSQVHPGHARATIAFWLWGWTMVLVVLLSAMPTGAQVRARAIGSAFDPATTSVALNPKRPKLDTSVLQADGDKRRDYLSGPSPLAAPAAEHATSGWRLAEIGGSEFAAPPALASHASPLARAFAARAPPRR